ncbi:histidinol-phosphatase [Enterovirga aerilata]|uniref:Histidinol-phosphatase n=1 Tax=Enterovirga aerilata TaxID=2730920 RepID=A0A849I926_9HYPH|nr:histidinol-phosphatase [Enterovirga sp. DB1703]NNM74304.1 histidinol-phosphatase [Enterovirga sp. DB1703]
MKPVDFSSFVNDLATKSGQAILPFFRTMLSAEDKSRGGVFDPVTEADRAGEIAMRRMIGTMFPSHGIIGEEFGAERPDAEFVWVLDPIDGTRAFMAGLPLWGTLIGLTRNGAPAYGLMHQPFIGERFFGDGGSAGYVGPHGERKLATRRCRSLADAVLSTTSPRLFETDLMAGYERIESAVKLTRFGYDCYAYCMLAAGHLDLVIESGLKPYDIVPLIPIIEGAGGIVTSWDGGPATQGGSIVACGDKRLHDSVIERLRG